ncbi:44556_t:CDS:1, partial [Gigaspora margarita]
RSNVSFIKKIGNFYKGCFHHDRIERCSKNEKEAINCFEIAAIGDHEEARKTKKTTQKTQNKIKYILILSFLI